MAKRQPCDLCGNPNGFPYTITANEGLATVELCDNCAAPLWSIVHQVMTGKGKWMPRRGHPRRRMDDIRYEE